MKFTLYHLVNFQKQFQRKIIQTQVHYQRLKMFTVAIFIIENSWEKGIAYNNKSAAKYSVNMQWVNSVYIV